VTLIVEDPVDVITEIAPVSGRSVLRPNSMNGIVEEPLVCGTFKARPFPVVAATPPNCTKAVLVAFAASCKRAYARVAFAEITVVAKSSPTEIADEEAIQLGVPLLAAELKEVSFPELKERREKHVERTNPPTITQIIFLSDIVSI